MNAIARVRSARFGLGEALTANKSMRTFYIIWAGHVVSRVGSRITSFALGVWIVEKTGSTAAFSMLLAVGMLPGAVGGLFLGPLVDRWNRKWSMVVSELLRAVTIVGMLSVALFADLHLWIIYALAAFGSLAGRLYGPAFTASITVLVPESKRDTANAFRQMTTTLRDFIGPMTGGFLLSATGLTGVFALDVVTFGGSIIALSLITIPSPSEMQEGDPESLESSTADDYWEDFREGLAYIKDRVGIALLLSLLAGSMMFVGAAQTLITPMVLAFSTKTVLGIIEGLAGAGFFVGILITIQWEGPSDRILGILACIGTMAAGALLLGVRPSVYMVAIGFFVAAVASPPLFVYATTLLQEMVPSDIQGRVFSVRGTCTTIATLVGYVVAGSLADTVFEPLLLEGGLLADSVVGRWVGVGPGRGLGLFFLFIGAGLLLVAGLGYVTPSLRSLTSKGSNARD